MKSNVNVSKGIVEAIVLGNSDYIEYTKTTKNQYTRTGNGYKRRDYIHTAINSYLSTLENIEVYKKNPVGKGSHFKHVLIYDRKTKFLYLVISKRSYRQAKRKAQLQKETPHYVEAYALINRDFHKSIIPYNIGQMALNFDNERNVYVVGNYHKLKEEFLTSSIGDLEVEAFVAVAYQISSLDNSVVSVEAITPDMYIQSKPINTQDWSDLLPVDYGIDNERIANNDDNQEERSYPLGLKEKHVKTADASLKQLKREKEGS